MYDIKRLFSSINNNMIFDEKMICNIYELEQCVNGEWK